jgi:hypothetical protein
MTEVEVVIRFNQHSLGDCRYQRVSRMLHAPDGRVMFPPAWWQALMRYAAQVLDKHQSAVKDIDWAPVVEGTPKEYRRYYASGRYTTHEAFFPGDQIVVQAVIPAEITTDDFKELLAVAGKYKGISPYRKDNQYGTFDVVTVTSKRAAK